MSDQKDTAASPESEETTASLALNEEEQAKLNELQAKKAGHAAAEAAKAAEEAKAAKKEELERIANRPLYHVLVRHMARSPRTRTMRAARAGHRRQGVLLDDGTRIRKKGARYTEVDLRELVRNNQRFLEYVRVGAVEVCDPKTEHTIPYDGLVEMIKKVALWVAEMEAQNTLKQHEAAMEKYEAEMEAWKEACKAEEKAAKEEKREPRLPAEPVKPADLPKEKPEAIKVDESGLQQDPVLGSEAPENAAPPPKGSSTEVTREMAPGESELIAKVDQHEAEMRGEANPPPEETEEEPEETEEESDEGEGYTEEQLLAMGLDDLKALAVKDFGIDKADVKKLRAKKDVVELIMGAGASEDEE